MNCTLSDRVIDVNVLTPSNALLPIPLTDILPSIINPLLSTDVALTALDPSALVISSFGLLPFHFGI